MNGRVITVNDDILAATKRWIDGEIDEHARTELSEILTAARSGNAEAESELLDRMGSSLSFGTAGLRGSMRAGSNGMNRAVVIRCTAGLAHWLTTQEKSGIVVVGFDGRHHSERFAHDAAEVFAAADFDVHVLPEPLPTPVLVFTVRKLRAVAGVQITASHNPPSDNGYKVYLDGGLPLTSPRDNEITSAISEVGPANSVPRRPNWTHWHDAVDAYVRHASTVPISQSRQVRMAATALHGVGAKTLRGAMRAAGFAEPRVVPAQENPDPEFPTVAFPNPEEAGATDALVNLARSERADLAIALDPDADRCAVGIPDQFGRWRMLRGDETGALLGEYVLSTLDRDAFPDPLVATTIVSSTLLGKLAAKYRARYAETLTGFKHLIRAGPNLVYCYEEAIGHCVAPSDVPDKDGITAALLIADLAAKLQAEGKTLHAMLDAIDTEHGVHRTDQVSIRVDDLSRISEIMSTLRRTPPHELLNTPIEVNDLLPRADALLLRGGNLRVVIRPSGTEPKLKCYLQVVLPPSTALADAREHAEARITELRDAVTRLTL